MDPPPENAERNANAGRDGDSADQREISVHANRAVERAMITSESVAGHLVQIEMEVNRLQRAIRLTIQTQLADLAGCSLGSVESNQELVTTIHQMLDNHGLRVRCPECGHPAILRVSPRAGAKQGAFVFDHTIDGRRTFHGGRGTVPEIKLVAKPKRRLRSK